MNSFDERLSDTISNARVFSECDCCGIVFEKSIDETITAIKALINEMLPEEEEKGTQVRFRDPETHGWNACLTELKKRLNLEG